jgi:hypothetical protein
MLFTGPLKKMKVFFQSPVKYTLEIGDDLLLVNDLIGKHWNFQYQHKTQCFCGYKVDKIFRQNFCYDCFYSKPEAGDFILRPELSKAHLGIEDRDLEWEKAYQLKPHIVYLADSGGLKVGVTRKEQMPTRWIDQGASSAIILAEVPNRYLAGELEVALKQHISDKTVVKKMLGNSLFPIDLIEEKQKVLSLVPEHLRVFLSGNSEIPLKIEYPRPTAFEHQKSISLEKEAQFSSTLVGIRGQYLLFEQGKVLNVRSHEGKIIHLDIR